MPEIRIDASDEEVSTLDAYIQVMGGSRNRVVLGLLEEWTQKQIHVAKVILRVQPRNPIDPASDRH